MVWEAFHHHYNNNESSVKSVSVIHFGNWAYKLEKKTKAPSSKKCTTYFNYAFMVILLFLWRIKISTKIYRNNNLLVIERNYFRMYGAWTVGFLHIDIVQYRLNTLIHIRYYRWTCFTVLFTGWNIANKNICDSCWPSEATNTSCGWRHAFYVHCTRFTSARRFIFKWIWLMRRSKMSFAFHNNATINRIKKIQMYLETCCFFFTWNHLKNKITCSCNDKHKCLVWNHWIFSTKCSKLLQKM